jgi:hypothetical protein
VYEVKLLKLLKKAISTVDRSPDLLYGGSCIFWFWISSRSDDGKTAKDIQLCKINQDDMSGEAQEQYLSIKEIQTELAKYVNAAQSI